jgi:glycosyltransferase involved in cell wall biosynthesis
MLPRVQFTDFVPEACLPALYSGALAFVYPSIYEGFGLPVAEAMASGCVPIVSNATALPEVAGSAGLTVDPFNVDELGHAVVTICKNEELRCRLRQKAIRESERFRWDRAAERVRQVLEQAAA